MDVFAFFLAATSFLRMALHVLGLHESRVEMRRPVTALRSGTHSSRARTWSAVVFLVLV